MDDVKNKMYHYEITPPEGVWEAITTELDGQQGKVIPLAKKRNYTFYYAAAAIAVLVFAVIFFTTRSSGPALQYVSSDDKNKVDTSPATNFIMTVPVEEKNRDNKNDQLVQHKTHKNAQNEKKNGHETFEDSNIVAVNTTRYITIEGPLGQPVKISSKMATLIDSSETKSSSKPIWNKKINEWREKMKVNTLAPTPGNFMDIIELTKTLREQ